MSNHGAWITTPGRPSSWLRTSAGRAPSVLGSCTAQRRECSASSALGSSGALRRECARWLCTSRERAREAFDQRRLASMQSRSFFLHDVALAAEHALLRIRARPPRLRRGGALDCPAISVPWEADTMWRRTWPALIRSAPKDLLGRPHGVVSSTVPPRVVTFVALHHYLSVNTLVDRCGERDADNLRHDSLPCRKHTITSQFGRWCGKDSPPSLHNNDNDYMHMCTHSLPLLKHASMR